MATTNEKRKVTLHKEDGHPKTDQQIEKECQACLDAGFEEATRNARYILFRKRSVNGQAAPTSAAAPAAPAKASKKG